MNRSSIAHCTSQFATVHVLHLFNFSILLFRNLRKELHSKLLINLCFALVGLYVTFIISTVSTGVPVLCGVVSALMHYFFLAVFFWMAAEAIYVHRKLVYEYKQDIANYFAITMAICWGKLVLWSNVIIVAKICLFSSHIHYSYSDSSVHGYIYPSSTISELHPPTIVS